MTEIFIYKYDQTSHPKKVDVWNMDEYQMTTMTLKCPPNHYRAISKQKTKIISLFSPNRFFHHFVVINVI
jgi:hypothetical protein